MQAGRLLDLSPYGYEDPVVAEMAIEDVKAIRCAYTGISDEPTERQFGELIERLEQIVFKYTDFRRVGYGVILGPKHHGRLSAAMRKNGFAVYAPNHSNEFVLKHPKPDVRIGVGCVVVRRNPELQLLLGLRNGTHGETLWALPGGALESWENFEECAKRELFEETGMSCVRATALHGGMPLWMHARTNQTWYTVIAECVVPPDKTTAVVREPHKCKRWEWFPLDKLPPDATLFQPTLDFIRSMHFSRIINAH